MIDVLVIGGGNAALCAALMAAEAGASVLVLEAAPREWRGGNSQHTRNLRCMHDAPEDHLTGVYSESEYWNDLLEVTGGETNEALARIVIRGSADCRRWMVQQGARFQPSLGGTLHLSRNSATRAQTALDLGAYAFSRGRGNLVELDVDLAGGASRERPEKFRCVDTGMQEREQRPEITRARNMMQRRRMLAKPRPVRCRRRRIRYRPSGLDDFVDRRDRKAETKKIGDGELERHHGNGLPG